MINVKLCLMVVHIELCHSYHFQWPWLYFKVTAVSDSLYWEFYVLIQLCWNFEWLLITSSRSWAHLCFLFLRVFKGGSRHIALYKENHTHFNIDFFSDTVKARSFKLCLIITLLEVYIFIVGLMTLTLFQGRRSIRNINCKFCFQDSCLDSWLL